MLRTAQTLYILDAEVVGEPGRFVGRLVRPPHVPGKRLWLVVRLETLDIGDAEIDRMLADLVRWQSSGNRIAGVQLDFDARTRHLDRYAEFLARFRRRLPQRFALSVTGLLDWSANGDPAALNAIGDNVSEVVLQTYQGRSTIPGYEAYIGKLGALRIPFRIGLVQGGAWREPSSLRRNPNFRGYVVFLVNPLGPKDRGRKPLH